MSGKIKCVTFCCVTQTKQACKLSARNYRFEILQRIQIKKRRLIGENSFEVQIRHLFLKVLHFNKRRRDGNKSFGLIANTRCFSDVVDPGRQDGYYERVRTEPDI